jgi:hypothetical protein
MLKGITPFLLMLIADYSCRQQIEKKQTQDVVNTWIGRTIKFPQDNFCWILGEASPCRNRSRKMYNILLYTDSSGCMSCKLRIDEWKRLMKDVDSSVISNVNFIFYFNPKKNDDLSELFKRENFRKEVHIDLNDELNRMNKFPLQMEYQCFLLDEHNKVLLVGNPTLSSSVRNLYFKTLNEQTNFSTRN